MSIDDIEGRARSLTDSLDFPPIHDRMCEGSRSVLTWVIGYLNRRIDLKSDEDKAREYLDSIGQNSSLIASRFRGAMLGLAIGDALGTTLEFSQRDTLPKVTKIIGGGPFNLKPGQWTDDTSMALCMAHSLIRREYLSYTDHLDLFTLWWKKGIFSVNGRCFDIGNTVVNALTRYQQTGEHYSGPTDPSTAGNGSLMRLAPVALFYFSDAERCTRWCGESSRTTHGAEEAVDACRYFGALLLGAIRGDSKASLTKGLYEPFPHFWATEEPLAPSIIMVATEAYTRSRNEIKSTGYVVDTLEAAIWAFHNTTTFEEGAILAANLGGDADTIGAVYGQLAGAYYGEHSIDPNWIKTLSHFHIFYHYADKLLRFGVCDYPELTRRLSKR